MRWFLVVRWLAGVFWVLFHLGWLFLCWLHLAGFWGGHPFGRPSLLLFLLLAPLWLWGGWCLLHFFGWYERKGWESGGPSWWMLVSPTALLLFAVAALLLLVSLDAHSFVYVPRDFHGQVSSQPYYVYTSTIEMMWFFVGFLGEITLLSGVYVKRKGLGFVGWFVSVGGIVLCVSWFVAYTLLRPSGYFFG